MQINWLEDFVELARTRSFTRAAANRFVTHPAFGRRIRALEQWVGTPLVERSKPLALTAAGTVFLDAADDVVNILHDARTQLQDTVPQLDNHLRIATGRTLASTFFPNWYLDATQRVGFFSTAMSTSGANEAILRLVSGEVDLLIVYASPLTRLLLDRERFDCFPVARENVVPVSSLDHRGRARFRPAGGGEPLPWLSFAKSQALRAVLARHLAQLPVTLNLKQVCQSDSYESIMELALRGVGLAWLPYRLVQDEVSRGGLVVVGDSNLQVSVDITLYRQRHRSHAVLDALWKTLVDGSADK
ncbi:MULTISPECIES: LysR substrate-binding domain-containing protein [unclassified Herbaspirillum]|uniref:LysR family transcriptional regulator n=1 Tax=unclassified Herbaspirillum TaxID=2624150 RepID=UPI000E2F8E1A|nr:MULTISPECIES: LysR substrate-binding domain-containing protein [unclassified Herbaspirillum]RFB71165.1 LysR family transcriptional regulator [Herbaspirillum sp. 3R-3a1]TFI08306.1 LysR family transcriptional regulator [Herbaspirillum sp. 3R11]TFI14721.1 LysR family transcriptional regulator [Herbaspirillum sp. 3R-11]TFI31887.1 LysR family transcriptional regulator [Herbaspirillum sp. 3C11]TFI32030.1 LysR family transcriptional regulator [Herbaspirillum sp. 3C11]